jgi:predicted Zn-dependent protease
MSRLVLSFLLLASSGFAAPYYPRDPLTIPGFVAFYNNQYGEAYAYFKTNLRANPNDPDSYNHLAQTILYRELFRDGALESEMVSGNNPFLHSAKLSISPEAKEEFAACIQHSLQLSSASLERDPDDAHALYSAGVAHGLKSNYSFLVEKAWIESLREAAAANKANKRVLALQPDFTDSRLVVGLYEYVAGSLPFYMRMLGAVGGFHGHKDSGIDQLQEVAEHGTLNKYDAQIILAVIYRREHQSELALPLLQHAANQFPGNYLFRLEEVEMYSDVGNKAAALGELAEVERLRRAGAPGYNSLCPGQTAYLRGNLLFWYGDFDSALVNLKQATVAMPDLNLNTAVMSWLRLGQTYDLKKNHGAAIQAYKEVIATAPQSAPANEANNYIARPYHRKMKNG